MIPLGIKVKGFLSYRDEQEIRFDGENNLWILSGPNGSGKSAIFDALTYAIFGHHRGGGQQVQELINKDSDGLLVEFDFQLAEKSYRIKRTVRRRSSRSPSSTQQIYQKPLGSENYIAISGTENKRDGFDPWIREQIGLTYETFTSSVLLLQGKAEKLLDSRPEGRREVLASIVDLERYERLHRLADDRRKTLDGELKSLQSQLESLPEVSADVPEKARQAIEEVARERETARGDREQLQKLEFEARSWQENEKQRNLASFRLNQAQRLLENTKQIQENLDRYRELQEVIPRLETIASLNQQIHGAQQTIQTLKTARDVGLVELKKLQGLLDRLLHKQNTIKQVIQSEEIRQQNVQQQLQQSTAQMEQLHEYEEQTNQMQTLLASQQQFPSDPVGETRKLKAEVDLLAELAQILPVLTRLQNRREDLRRTAEKLEKMKQQIKDLIQEGEQKNREVEQARSRLDTAIELNQKANDQVTVLRTRVKQAEASLADLQILDGASKVCRACGQAITAGHLEEENRRRSQDLANEEKKLQPAVMNLETTRRNEATLKEQYQGLVGSLQELRNHYQERNSECKQLQADFARLQQECSECFTDLPSDIQDKIAVGPPLDWLATTYPNSVDLQQLGTQVSRLFPVRSMLLQAENQQREWETFQAKKLVIQQALERLKKYLPPEPEQVRKKHQEIQLESQALLKTLQSSREQLLNLDGEYVERTAELENARGQIDSSNNQIREQEMILRHAMDALASTQKLLPSTWVEPSKRMGIRELAAWKSEAEELRNQGIEKRGQELLEARANLDYLQNEWMRIDQEAQRFSQDARVPLQQIQQRIEESRKLEQVCEKKWIEANQEMLRLETELKQRDNYRTQILATDRDRTLQKLLADLLGKDRLQLYLVRNAERKIIEYANGVLDRLSGGQISLRLSGEADGEGSTARALDLEAVNRTTGDKPIQVAYLSGSQKFRVAVSMALGIGQFASQQKRPMESVIIDEGFGCLDQQGRQVMIQELQNLRGHLRCILLVSHQEEFADAFSNGYSFEMNQGATRVRRIQK